MLTTSMVIRVSSDLSMRGSILAYFSDLKNLSRCSSSLKMRCPKVLVVSNTEYPCKNPLS